VRSHRRRKGVTRVEAQRAVSTLRVGLPQIVVACSKFGRVAEGSRLRMECPAKLNEAWSEPNKGPTGTPYSYRRYDARNRSGCHFRELSFSSTWSSKSQLSKVIPGKGGCVCVTNRRKMRFQVQCQRPSWSNFGPASCSSGMKVHAALNCFNGFGYPMTTQRTRVTSPNRHSCTTDSDVTLKMVDLQEAIPNRTADDQIDNIRTQDGLRFSLKMR
jgi:hypothetical protein